MHPFANHSFGCMRHGQQTMSPASQYATCRATGASISVQEQLQHTRLLLPMSLELVHSVTQRHYGVRV